MIEYAVRFPNPDPRFANYIVHPLPHGITEDMAREWVPLAGPGAVLVHRNLPEWTVTP